MATSLGALRSGWNRGRSNRARGHPDQKTLVQQTFASIAPIADDAAQLFYRRLFELDPSLQAMFRGDMTEQRRKLMNMIGAAVKGLDRLEQLVPVVQDLGRKHVGYGVEDRHYDTVGAALLWTSRDWAPHSLRTSRMRG